jgi:hypothetical protein
VNLLIGPDKVFFYILITFSYLNFFLNWPSQYTGFKLSDPEIVTALRIFHTF